MPGIKKKHCFIVRDGHAVGYMDSLHLSDPTVYTYTSVSHPTWHVHPIPNLEDSRTQASLKIRKEQGENIKYCKDCNKYYLKTHKHKIEKKKPGEKKGKKKRDDDPEESSDESEEFNEGGSEEESSDEEEKEYEEQTKEIVSNQVKSNKRKRDQEKISNPIQDVSNFIFIDILPKKGDIINVWYEDVARYYRGTIERVENNNDYYLKHANGKLFPENPLSLQLSDQSIDINNTNRWHFVWQSK
jgi:hypothetical protein